MMNDIFELAQKERELKLSRILSLRELLQRDNWRQKIALALWNATWKGYGNERNEPSDVIENFCQDIFGVSYDQVLKAEDIV